jgi:hypothetical protein
VWRMADRGSRRRPSVVRTTDSGENVTHQRRAPEKAQWAQVPGEPRLDSRRELPVLQAGRVGLPCGPSALSRLPIDYGTALMARSPRLDRFGCHSCDLGRTRDHQVNGLINLR